MDSNRAEEAVQNLGGRAIVVINAQTLPEEGDCQMLFSTCVQQGRLIVFARITAGVVNA